MAKAVKNEIPVIRAKYIGEKWSRPVETESFGGGAQQHFKDQCDINKIAKMIEASGSPDHVREARARYGDFSEIFDVGVNMDKAAKAQQLWEQLPVEMRNKTGNSISQFFKYIQDDANYDECVKMGIYDKGKNKDGSPRVEKPADPPAASANPPAEKK